METEEIKQILENHERRLKELEQYLPGKEVTPVQARRLEEKVRKLCDELGIEVEKFYELFYIDESKEEIILLFSHPGKSESEKQLKITLIVLTLLGKIFEKDFIMSSELNVILKKMGVGSLVNLSTNLSKYKNFFIPRGKSKSPKSGFQITFPGRNEGMRIIKELSKNG